MRFFGVISCHTHLNTHIPNNTHTIRLLLTVISFYANSQEDSHTIFRDAAALNMTESGYVWIVTEQALNANNTPGTLIVNEQIFGSVSILGIMCDVFFLITFSFSDGVIGLQLVHAKNEKNHIRVSIAWREKKRIE